MNSGNAQTRVAMTGVCSDIDSMAEYPNVSPKVVRMLK